MKRNRTKAYDVLLFDTSAPKELRFENEVREYAIEWLDAYHNYPNPKCWAEMSTEELADLYEELNIYMDYDYYYDYRFQLRNGEDNDDWLRELQDEYEREKETYRSKRYYYGCRLEWIDELAIMNGCDIDYEYASEISEEEDGMDMLYYDRCLLSDTDPRKFWNVNLRKSE